MDGLVLQYLDEIKKHINYFEDLNKCLLGNTKKMVFAYRGEPEDYGETKLTPSIFRNTTYVQNERYLFELLQDYNVIKSKRNIEKMIDAQHYVSISRALDITFNALVALYFACIKSLDRDGVIYIFCFPEYVSPHSNYIEEIYEKILEGDENQIIDKNFKVISHARNNERITAQSGGFIFFPGKKKYKLSEVYYKSLFIDANSKEKVIIELDRFFGINEAALFPEKDKIADYVKEIFVGEYEYKNRKITVEDQIEEYLKRLDYELELEKTIAGNDYDVSKYLMRRVRKEQDDLKNYIKRNCKINNVESMMIKLDVEIEKLRRSKRC